MATLTVNYGDLNYTVNQSQDLAKRSREYADTLSRNVTNRISSLKGGSSYNTNQSADYLRHKIRELNSKADRHDAFAKKVSAFVQIVQNTDRAVKSSFEVITSNFKKTNNINISAQNEVLTNISIFLEKNPLFKWAGDRINDVKNWASDCCSNIKHWYKCEGGKYTVDAIFAGVAVAVSVVAIAVSIMTGIGGIVAIAGFIGLCISTLNSANDIRTSVVAAGYANSNPLTAARYGEMNNLSDSLRKEVHGPCAKFAYGAAGVLDTTEAVCDIIGIAAIGKTVVKRGPAALKNLFGNKNKGLGKSFLSRVKGTHKQVVTFKGLQKGFKTYSKNGFKLAKQAAGKFGTELKSNIKDGFKHVKANGFKNNMKDGFQSAKKYAADSLKKLNSYAPDSDISKKIAEIKDNKKFQSLTKRKGFKTFTKVAYASDQLNTIVKPVQNGFKVLNGDKSGYMMTKDSSIINKFFGITKDSSFKKIGSGITDMKTAIVGH